MSLTTATIQFMDVLAKALDPKLPTYLLREDNQFAIFAGLWSTWMLNNETNQRAKVVMVTVLKEPGAPAPPGPMPFSHLIPWLVLQMHIVDEENPVWDDLQKVLSSEFSARNLGRTTTKSTKSSPTPQPLILDSSQDNHYGRAMIGLLSGRGGEVTESACTSGHPGPSQSGGPRTDTGGGTQCSGWHSAGTEGFPWNGSVTRATGAHQPSEGGRFC